LDESIDPLVEDKKENAEAANEEVAF